MNTVGGAVALTIPMVPTAHIFHTAVAVPIAYHGDEHIAAFLAYQQTCVSVLSLIPICRPGLLLEQSLHLLPFLPLYHDRKEVLVAIPFFFIEPLDLAAVGFAAVVIQHAGVCLLYQHIFDAGISSEELAVTGFVRMPKFSAAPLGSELCRGLSFHNIEPAGYLFLPISLQVQRIDEPHRDRCFCVNLDLPVFLSFQ